MVAAIDTSEGEFTVVQLAEANCLAQSALLADAQAQHDAAAKARADAEQALADADRAHTIARAAWSAKRDDAELHGRCRHAEDVLSLAREDAAAARSAHERAAADLTSRKAFADKTENALEVARIMTTLNDGSAASVLKESVGSIVGAVETIRKTAIQIREKMLSDNRQVQRVRELGGPADLALHDGTAAGGALMSALLEAGGALEPGQAVHQLRWAWEQSVDYPDDKAIRLTKVLVEIVLGSLVSAKHEGAELGRARMARLGPIWSRHRDRRGAELEVGSIERVEADANAREANKAHELRLEEKRERDRTLEGLPAYNGKPRSRCVVCNGFVEVLGNNAVALGQRRFRHRGCQPVMARSDDMAAGSPAPDVPVEEPAPMASPAQRSRSAPQPRPSMDPPEPPVNWREGEYVVGDWGGPKVG